ncbi:protein TBATA [Centroberyx affinis]|uniref:protein TBATA n=1 Tax=Centroberyx affinis TaxID=166261 RepID=UPI003A5BCB9A
MSRPLSPDSQMTTGERGVNYANQVPFTTEWTKMVPKSSPRFGALSHHSFFSRHNPHPHRVTHIQGLNGRPVCMVNDDWSVTTSLFPHPLIKSQGFRTATGAPFALPLGPNLSGVNSIKNKSALLSEAWREELKELAAKVNLSSQAKKDKKDDQSEEEFGRRKTQYSAQTGRIIPPSTKAYQRRSHSQRTAYPQPFYDQELMVLELLCQILQTDSLSLVQQWLLLSGQRAIFSSTEKDLVMGMIQQALEGIDISGHQQSFGQVQALHTCASLPVQGPSFSQSWRKPRRTSSYQMQRSSSDDKPERIGDAEVLEVHGAQHHPQDDPLQHVDSI